MFCIFITGGTIPLSIVTRMKGEKCHCQKQNKQKNMSLTIHPIFLGFGLNLK